MIDTHVASWPGSLGKPNEDAFAAIADFVVVADGATAPPSLGTGCIHDPRWYARQLCTEATAACTRRPDDTLPDIVSSAIRMTAAAHSKTCDPSHPGTPSATVAAIRARDGFVDWLVLGDATLVLETGDGLRALCDDRLFRSNTELRNAVLHSRADASDRPQKVAALVDAQRRFRNRDGGFWVAASDPEAGHKALVGTESSGASGRWRAALLTDGAAAAVDTYRLTDWAGMLDILAAAGPANVLASIRKVEADDPQTSTYPRIKRSDDATIAYLSGVAQ